MHGGGRCLRGRGCMRGGGGGGGACVAGVRACVAGGECVAGGGCVRGYSDDAEPGRTWALTLSRTWGVAALPAEE